MNSIPLETGYYTGTYKLIAGEISLDFVNTISYPGTEREHDWLDRPGNFTEWAFAIDIINRQKVNELNKSPRSNLIKELGKVHQIRKNLTDILKPLAFNKQPSSESIDTLNILVHQICKNRNIDQKSYKWIWYSPQYLSDVLAPIIWNAAHVLTKVDHTRISYCPTCEWIFYDTTRNRSRRWCDMEDCGSRQKSLNYYHRKTQYKSDF